NRYPLAGWVLSPLPETCQRERLALGVDYLDQPADLGEVRAFAREYLRVPMLLYRANLAAVALPALLESAPNVLCHVSAAAPAAELAELVNRFGEHRFAFGSDGFRASPEFPSLGS